MSGERFRDWPDGSFPKLDDGDYTRDSGVKKIPGTPNIGLFEPSAHTTARGNFIDPPEVPKDNSGWDQE